MQNKGRRTERGIGRDRQTEKEEDRQRQTVGRGGALVEAITFNRRVVGSTPDLAAT